MSMLIQHNMMAWNAERQFNTVTKAKNKKAEKLSSGYRINRAADDAAGLSISEKMRRQIRGLKVGTENAQMGISWVQIGEGALNEAHDILHRMNELSIKAQNGTNTLTDRAYMEAEFEQLQGELDRISTTTTFNELNIFEEHEPVYDQISGNINWDYEEYHDLRPGKNDLTITYRTAATDEAQVMTITVPTGRYTTHELIDAIDDAFGVDSPIHMEFTEKGFCRLNLEGGEVMDSVRGGLTYLLWDNYDGGGYGTLIGTTEFEKDTDTIKIVKGENDSMYLEMEFFDPNVKSTMGTINLLTDAELNNPNFKEIRLNKKQIMERINNSINANHAFDNSGLKASDYGTAIQLASDEGIVTGFKGNMFKIEKQNPIYTSAFYDNIQHGHVWQDPASVVGGAVLTTDVRDEEHNRFYIKKDVNDKLVLNPNKFTNSVKDPITITIPPKAATADNPTGGYTAQAMVDALNEIFEKTAGLKGEVEAHLVRSSAKVRDPYPDKKNPGSTTATKDSVGDDDLIFEGIEIRTVKEGPDAIVNIDKDASTAYDTLFTIKNYNKYGTGTGTNGWDANVDNETQVDSKAYAKGEGAIGSIKFTSANNRFNITLKSTPDRNQDFDDFSPPSTPPSTDFTQTFTVNVGTGTKSIGGIISAINADLANKKLKVGKDAAGNDIEVALSTRIEAVRVDQDGKVSSSGEYIKIVDKEDLTLDSVNHTYPNWYTEIDVSSCNGNAGYRTLFQKRVDYTEVKTHTFTGKADLTIPSGGLTKPITFSVNGVSHTIGGAGMSASGVKTDFEKETPIRFSNVASTSQTRPQNFTVKGDGTTSYTYYAGGNAQGDSIEYQGKAGYEMNTPATLEVGPAKIPSSVVIDDSNNKISLALNGKPYTFTIANCKDASGNPSAFDLNKDGKYSQDELEAALQDAIDKAAGEGFGGAQVEIKGNQFVITSKLGTDDDGKKTSITAYAQGTAVNTFFDSLVRSETAASCTTTLDVQSNISMTGTGGDDIFRFSFTDKDGNTTPVTLDLMKDGESSPTNIGSLVQRINDRLADEGLADKVKADKSGSKLVLITKETGANTHIEYTTGDYPNATANAKAIFGDIQTSKNDPPAKVTLNQPAKKTVNFDNSTDIKTFRVKIDGTWREVKIKGGWNGYSGSGANTLETKLNKGLSGDGSDGLEAWGVKASVSNGGTITLTRQHEGSLNGKATSIEMSYGDGGSVMKDMFGSKQMSTIEGVSLSVSGNKLTITAGANDVITIVGGAAAKSGLSDAWGDQSGGTLKGKAEVKYYSHTKDQGFHSAKFSTVTSVDLSRYVENGKVAIELNKWNNELEFEFTENGTATTEADQKWKKVSFRLTESGAGNKTSIDDIVKELQTEITKVLGKYTSNTDGEYKGKDKVEVIFDAKTNRLSLKSTKPGAQFQFRGMVSARSNGDPAKDATNKIGGGFFHHVMCRSEEQKGQLADPTDINGDQFPDDIFAQGRHDVVFDPAHLHPGTSDTLILDLNYLEDSDHDGFVDADKNRDGIVDTTELKDAKTITLKLNFGSERPYTKPEYWLSSNKDEVLKTLRDKIKEAIKDWNGSAEAQKLGFELHEDLIEVDVGRHQTGIWGNKDNVAVSFTMTKNPDIATPVEGYFYIDGIRGNAAYEVFYHTDGELIPAYIEGTKDIRDGVVLNDDDNELVLLVDGKMETIDLSSVEKGKKFSSSEIIKILTDKFKEKGLNLAVALTPKGSLRFSFDRMGKHTLEQVTGSARNKLFFEEHSAKRMSKERDIRVSSFEGDRLSVYSPRFSTAMLGINSICISTIKNAEKATNRLKEAIRKVSDMRSTFGAIQNRFEHTVNNNLNKHENLQAAESRIRDADISKEMMDFSNLSIIQQAGQAVLAQANQSRNAMLTLLG